MVYKNVTKLTVSALNVKDMVCFVFFFSSRLSDKEKMKRNLE